MKDFKEILDKPRTEKEIFRVPEGYFDTIGSRIMANIPQETEATAHKPQPLWIAIKKTRYAVAAAVAALVMGIGTVVYNNNVENNTSSAALANKSNKEAASTAVANNEYMKECMDYAMLDNNDVYMYLSAQ